MDLLQQWGDALGKPPAAAVRLLANAGGPWLPSQRRDSPLPADPRPTRPLFLPGEEFYNKGANVALGPGMNVARIPTCGRNFEYVSGEDPFFGYTAVQPIIRGIQSKGVIANAKVGTHL